ncbi:MAG TPA: DUF933 domain-containing protein, partial [Acidimicrobiales bacterium]|nr:DUF933 domain-containing protein [Acidimicrobiales bacterium]
DDEVIHVDGRIDPAGDVATVETEMVLADLQTVDRALGRLERDTKRSGDAGALTAALAARDALNRGEPISLSAGVDRAGIADLHLLTAKPFIYVFNVDEAQLSDPARRAELAASVAPAPSVVLCAKVEAELTELDDAEAREMLSAFGQAESGLVQLSRVGFDTLGLQTFLTAGPKEARAWTIRAGATAPEAAGVIHSDFERHFIKAEVASYDELVAAGSLAALRAAGRARIEGRDYVMRDGDVVEFRVGV